MSYVPLGLLLDTESLAFAPHDSRIISDEQVDYCDVDSPGSSMFCRNHWINEWTSSAYVAYERYLNQGLRSWLAQTLAGNLVNQASVTSTDIRNPSSSVTLVVDGSPF